MFGLFPGGENSTSQTGRVTYDFHSAVSFDTFIGKWACTGILERERNQSYQNRGLAKQGFSKKDSKQCFGNTCHIPSHIIRVLIQYLLVVQLYTTEQ